MQSKKRFIALIHIMGLIACCNLNAATASWYQKLFQYIGRAFPVSAPTGFVAATGSSAIIDFAKNYPWVSIGGGLAGLTYYNADILWGLVGEKQKPQINFDVVQKFLNQKRQNDDVEKQPFYQCLKGLHEMLYLVDATYDGISMIIIGRASEFGKKITRLKTCDQLEQRYELEFENIYENKKKIKQFTTTIFGYKLGEKDFKQFPPLDKKQKIDPLKKRLLRCVQQKAAFASPLTWYGYKLQNKVTITYSYKEPIEQIELLGSYLGKDGAEALRRLIYKDRYKILGYKKFEADATLIIDKLCGFKKEILSLLPRVITVQKVNLDPWHEIGYRAAANIGVLGGAYFLGKYLKNKIS